MSAAAALAVFEAALAQPASERRAFIERACDAEPDVCTRALALLAAHAASEGFLEPSPTAVVPRDLGAWRLLERIGSGGMGQVYLAERRDGAFEQRVAIKVLAAALGDGESVRRAEAERQFLAWLDHPNIAHVLDGGTTAEGQPYLVMELVDGQPIDAWCAMRALDPKARVRVFLQVVAAVEAAHAALIIHRDIKPANILVTPNGVAKLLDFGIAKSLDGRGRDAVTRAGAGLLTPDYASPEQFSGTPLTTACDIYALGLVLHEVLSGRKAFERGPLSIAEFAQRRSDTPPTRPSAGLDASTLGVAAGELARWRRTLAGDLDRVVLKALEPEPSMRYASARALGEDLERWLQDRPVRARTAGPAYRVAKFVRRHRLPTAIGLVAALAVVAGTTGALVQAHAARVAGERAQRANAFLVGIIEYSNPRVSGNAVRLVDALDHAVERIPHLLIDQPELEGDIRHALGEAYLGLERLDSAEAELARAGELRAADAGNAYSATLDVQAMLAWQRGDTDRAQALLARALAATDASAEGRLQRASVMSDHAALLGDLGRFGEALPLAEEAVRIGDGESGATLVNRAISWSNLASARYGLGQLESAGEAYRLSANLLNRVRPLPEFDLSINTNNQALLLDRLGRIAEALPLAERSVALKRKVLGDDTPKLTWPLSHLASLYARSGRADDARVTIDEALRLGAASLDAGSDDAALLFERAARVARDVGDRDDALQRATAALAIRERAGNDDAGALQATRALIAEIKDPSK